MIRREGWLKAARISSRQSAMNAPVHGVADCLIEVFLDLLSTKQSSRLVGSVQQEAMHRSKVV